MANLIERKKALASTRTENVKEILEELKKSNSNFTSSRQLSEYIAEKLTKEGKPVDSSTLRRKNSPYKLLIDEYVDKKEKSPEVQTKLALKIELQDKELQRLTALVDHLEHEVQDKENEIRLLIIEAQDKRNQVIASIAPPKASTYTQTELTQLKESHKLDRTQLSKAIEVIEALLKPELKTNNNSDGSYEIRNGKVIDLVAEIDLFNQESLPDFFKNR
ncbi:hypothetical protein [Vibrio splendidus]|uniref:hypothetical protein n=1 Tax=Vibrio splendidus TaxID=29497 RepID=UPI002159662F|nr:hypothetical protein [Vibrio splendidus]